MAKQHSAMTTLCELAQKEMENATLHLGHARKAQQQANEQLTMLINYQMDYRNQLNTDMSSGIASTRWSNYHQFIHTLEKAIVQHRQQLSNWDRKVDQALQFWRTKQQRLHAYETLQARNAATEQKQENRLEQKRMDEFAQRATLRKGE